MYKGRRKIKKKNKGVVEDEISRVKVPRKDFGELLGVVTGKLGYGRFKVFCTDGKERLGRIPGSKRRRMWVRIGNIVLIKLWEIQGDRKCDVIIRYSNAQAAWLKHKGYLDSIKHLLRNEKSKGT